MVKCGTSVTKKASETYITAQKYELILSKYAQLLSHFEDDKYTNFKVL